MADFVDAADENADAYTALEEYYRRQGLTEEAKQVHILRRQRERSALGWSHPLRYAWNLTEHIVAGYGQRLTRALLWSVVVVLVGCIVFRRVDWMETQKPDAAERDRGAYSPFWYSVALFLPISGLDDAKVWMPKRDRWKSRLYMRVHSILGYLLIPIGLAAWTGIIK